MIMIDAKDKTDGAVALAQLEDLLQHVRRGIELDLRVAAPATVLSYNAATQRADVQLGFVPVLFVEDEEVPQAPIVCPQVPVCWPGGSVGYVTTPLAPGDSGLVVFTDRCLAAWLMAGTPGDPINGRAHALGDGVFLPGLRATPDVITPPTDLAATVVEGPLVRLGQGAALGVVAGTGSATAALAAAVAALQAVALVPVPEPPAPGAGAAIDSIVAALIPLLQALVVSTKVLAAPTP